MTAALITTRDPLACAAVEALRAARWECAELLSRRPSLIAADLLRGHAAELAASALASDQVLGLALETTARNIEQGATSVDEADVFLAAEEGGAAKTRERLQTLVLQQSQAPSSVDVVGELERRLAARRLTPAELSSRLEAEAGLQQALWDDPRIPADISVRLAMLRSIPKLVQRAADLDGDPTPVWPNVPPRAARPVGRARFGADRTKASVGSSGLRWSSQQTGWLLIIALLVLALIATGAPIGAVPPN